MQYIDAVNGETILQLLSAYTTLQDSQGDASDLVFPIQCCLKGC